MTPCFEAPTKLMASCELKRAQVLQYWEGTYDLRLWLLPLPRKRPIWVLQVAERRPSQHFRDKSIQQEFPLRFQRGTQSVLYPLFVTPQEDASQNERPNYQHENQGPHGLQHTRLPCPLLSPRAFSNSCPLSQWCHPTIASSVVPFSSCLLSFPSSGSLPMSQFFASSGQITGALASASVLPMNIRADFV